MEQSRCPGCGKPMGFSFGHLCSECSTGGFNQDGLLRHIVDPPATAGTNELPTEVKRQPRKRRKEKGYTLSQVATAAGRAVVAVGTDNLPLEGQRKALELARRWLMRLDD